MRIFRIVVVVILLLLSAISVAAQSDSSATCETVVARAFAETQTQCADVGINQLCYGSGIVEAIPRYLTADFSFEDAGTTLDLGRIETISTRPLSLDEESYGVARLQIGEVDFPLDIVLFGNTFVANNVIPALALEMTVDTLVTVQAEPTSLSERVGVLVPGESFSANGRVNADGRIDVGENTWVRMQLNGVTGYIPAFVISEDYLIPSLTIIDPQDPVLNPLESMTFIGGGNDRGCNAAADSGMIVQTPAGSASLRINGAELTLAPATTIYVQAQPNAAMDVFVLEGGVNAQVRDSELPISAGQFVRAPIGLEGVVVEEFSEPAAYLTAKVSPLSLVNPALPRMMVISVGGDALSEGVVSSEVVISGGEDLVGVADTSDLGASEVVVDASMSVESVEAVVAAPAELANGDEEAPVPTGESGNTGVGSAQSPYAAEIRARGIIRVGVNGTLPRFSIEDDGNFDGFEVELAREVVRRLFGESVETEFVRVSARQRQSVMADGSVDLMMRNSAFDPERESWGEWTNTFYFIDGQRVLVRGESDIAGYADLSGEAIAVQANTPAESALTAVVGDYGFTVQPVEGIITDVFASFTNGEVAGVSADWTVLEALRATTTDPTAYRIIGEPLNDTPWSALVPPGRTAFASDVDAALLEIINDGTWIQLYSEIFDSTLPDSVALIFTPAGGTVVVAEADDGIANDDVGDDASAPASAESTVVESTGGIPIEGDVPVTIFTPQNQQRTVILTPLGAESFLLELRRGGEIVYDAEFEYYEGADRYENIRNSFEYITFSSTAGVDGLDCSREPDIRGFFNGADFEGRKGC